MTTQTYVDHFIKQSFGWSHVAGMAFDTREQAEQKIAELRAQYPNDEARFDVREVTHD